ncbi:hypothetical protein JHK82_044980 [Glycine max]|nr:hypothetical protein JHK86_045396 [Glycine max]KAG4952111.1 hypothetical protein JHK85_045978 [Glycine max]KAG5099928.1 hypothetical protein JHK82_044980 [Glycine max]KAG5108540.1 hypothetical protein JHK84_045447 [Glycine max]
MEFGLNSVYDFLLVQHRVRLGKYKRDSDSSQREGENLQAAWSPDAKLIAILVQLSDKRIHTGGKQPSALCLATISLLLTEQVPFAVKDLSV